jgi:hypothetical protein
MAWLSRRSAAKSTGSFDAVKQPFARDNDLARLAFNGWRQPGRAPGATAKCWGKTADGIDEIAKLVTEFRDLRLPRWRSLGAIPF